MTGFEDAARKLMDARLDAVRELAATVQDVQDKRRDLDQREADAWRKAVRAGWSEAELRQVGFTAPKGSSGRRRNTRATTTRTATISASEGAAGTTAEGAPGGAGEVSA